MRSHDADTVRSKDGSIRKIDAGSEAGWRQVYPVLVDCLAEGRAPSGDELVSVAGRIGREIGPGADTIWGRSRSDLHRRRMLLQAARVALTGGGVPDSPVLAVPPRPRGH